MEFIHKIVPSLTAAGLSSKVDTDRSIGKRYARTDEIGIPFAITIDYTTKENGTVTLRDRDMTSQIRVKIEEVASLVTALIQKKTTWKECEEKYPRELRKDEDADPDQN